MSSAIQEQGVFVYGDETITYDIHRKPEPAEDAKRPARKVKIKVNPDQRVIVTAPFDASQEAIHGAIVKQAGWIWQNLNEFKQQLEAVFPKQYISGEPKFYLGKRYVLKVQVESEQVPNVKLTRGQLLVTLRKHPDDDNASRMKYIKPMIDRWYQDKARGVFHERLAYLLPKASWVTGIPSFRVMAMKKQWGSCSAKGNLLLNPHLVKAPKECIDYVILHELCHIAEHNHSERFWRLLTTVMPEWKATKIQLDGMAEMYLNE